MLQEFEFDIYHQPGVHHAIADYLSRLESGESSDGVKDDFSDDQLFTIIATELAETMEDPEGKWLIDMTYFLSIGLPSEGMPRDEKKQLAVKSRNFCLIKDILYHKGADGVWRQCVRSDEKPAILREAHCGVAGGHYARDVTAWKVWQSGVWWQTRQSTTGSAICVS